MAEPAADPQFELVPIPLDRLPRDLQGDIDRKTGAPGAWRLQMGGASRPEQRLEVARHLDPTAVPYGDDNFLITHPRTGRRTLFNEEGLGWGDLASLAPEFG